MLAIEDLMADYSDLPESFRKEGYYSLGPIIDPSRARALLAEIRATRPFGPGLFLREEEHAANPQTTKNNPGPGFNAIEGMDLGFIEDHPAVRAAMERVLGPGYSVLLKKAICGVPHSWMPEWVVKEMQKNPGANLNTFIRPEYRNITFFRGSDWHQDIIDHRNRQPDFITMYVYLDDVTDEDSPLSIIPGSHSLGAATYPHDLSVVPDGVMFSDRRGHSVKLQEQKLLGSVGNIAFWHAYLLHGTRPTRSDRSRVSLRYLVQKGSAGGLLDEVNATLPGPKTLDPTVTRVDSSGQPIHYESILFGAADI
jgi:hypothetical protein